MFDADLLENISKFTHILYVQTDISLVYRMSGHSSRNILPGTDRRIADNWCEHPCTEVDPPDMASSESLSILNQEHSISNKNNQQF